MSGQFKFKIYNSWRQEHNHDCVGHHATLYRGLDSNVAEEEIAKQFPTERREMIFCAIHMTEKWPLFFCI
jgi:hypothetical protein